METEKPSEIPIETKDAPAETVAPTPVELDSDIVKIKILTGTLQFQQGTFQHDEIIEVTRKQAKELGDAAKIVEG